MARQAKTQNIIDQAREILEAFNPMTVRQVYYQLVSGQVIENNRSAYQAVSNALRDARLEGSIPWEWIEDRLRRPRRVAMWNDLKHFSHVAQQYRRVTLNVGRGYDGWDSIHNASERFGSGRRVTILYFGDFDPSGEDMVRSLRDRLAQLGSEPSIIKVALTLEDIELYDLPPNFTKATDSRRNAFVAKNGDVSVELDALPPDVLQTRLTEEVEQIIDMDALKAVQELQEQERTRLIEAFNTIGGKQ